MEEIWKNVEVVRGIDFTGYYEVSCFGNVKSIDRWVYLKNGGKNSYAVQIYQNKKIKTDI